MKQINDKLYIAPQLTSDDIHDAKEKGFAAIINNRPDGEETGQPTSSANRSVAQAEGMAYTHIPVMLGQVTEAQVRDFQNALSMADGLVLAHCKTGARSATLYAIGEVLDGRMKKAEVNSLGQRVGVDLAAAVKWLEANGH